MRSQEDIRERGPLAEGRYLSGADAQTNTRRLLLGGTGMLAEVFAPWQDQKELAKVIARVRLDRKGEPRPTGSPAQVAELARAGQSLPLIVATLGLNRYLVTRYWPADVPPKGFARRHAWSKCRPLSAGQEEVGRG